MKRTESHTPLPMDFKRAFGIIVPMCLVALVIAGIVISVSNDIYAFVKPDESTVLKIDTPLTDKELSDTLQEKNVIKNAFVFRLYLRSKGKANATSSLLGEWTLNSNMSYREIVMEIFKK